MNVRITNKSGANIRKSPLIMGQIVRTAIYGESLGVDKKISGQSIGGNKIWYVAKDGYLWSGNAEEIPEVQVYGQRNKAWKDVRLGSSPDYPWGWLYWWYKARPSLIMPGSIGMYGCTISSIGSYVRLNPEQVDTLFDRYGVYGGNTRNLVIWDRVFKALPGISSVTVLFGYDNAKVLKAIKAGHGVLAEVNADPIGVPSGRHWVRMLGDGKIMDPWFGDISSTSRYSTYYSVRILNKK